ncbi:MAG: hypothetical protein ACT4NU_01535 [Chromatiales bacterium]
MPVNNPASWFGQVTFPSGDVDMPWSWWNQFAPVVINQMKSADPPLERKIVTEVASYGRQIGRISEALAVLIERLPATGLTGDEQRALREFSEMAGAVAALKGGYKTPTQQNLQGIIAAINYWREHHDAFYGKVRAALLEEFSIDEKLPLKSAK